MAETGLFTDTRPLDGYYHMKYVSIAEDGRE
jgi:hypothetical protein